MRKDSHRKRKILAKLNSIDWWISHSPVPRNNAIKVIELLLKKQVEDVKTYYLVQWSRKSIKWGPPIKQRQIVRTKNPIIDIPPHLTTPALKEILFPEITLPDSRIGTQDIVGLKEMFGVGIEEKMSLVRQVRVLLNAMDTKEIYLPILPNSSNNLVPIKHAMLHYNFVLSTISVEDMRENTSWEPLLENFIRCLYVEAKLSNISIQDLRDICYNTTIMRKRVVDLLDLIGSRNSLEYVRLKALFERGSTLECRRDGLTTCTMPSDCRHTVIGNAAGCDTHVLSGNQMVSFQYGDIKGKFTHNGPWLRIPIYVPEP
ncbi:unnamed protein product [Arctia plantaginis]|uniref:Uncharacterized protein n=1 Tax=Arctia plantaginis TaxID=874455 RepID=A0A8S0YTF2_ARCPL|nr:unnamed protein product [Arctia plantaginis]